MEILENSKQEQINKSSKEQYFKNDVEIVHNFPKFVSMVEIFNYACSKFSDICAFKIKRNGVLNEWTYREYKKQVYKLSKSLLKMNLSDSCGVNINCYNCPEWVLAFFACVHIKLMATGIYTTSSPSQCEYLFNTSDSEMVFVQDEDKLKIYIEIKDKIPNCKAIVIMDSISKEEKEDYSNLPFKVFRWSEFIELGNDIEDSVIEEISSTITSEDIASLVFSSGTTSYPKACMISHKNYIGVCCDHSQSLFPKNTQCGTESLVSYLALSHITDQCTSIGLPLLFGGTIIFGDRNALKGSLLDTLKEFRPTYFFAVPRVWEKMQVKLQSELNSIKGIKKLLVDWSMKVGLENSNIIKLNETPSYSYMVANKLVYKKLMKQIGLDRCKIFASGAAPISKKTIEFFISIGINIRNFYGLTECCGGCFAETPVGKFGSAGKLLSGECKIAADGEILLKGDLVFKGYYKNQEATNEAIDQDGWFHTGDIGYLDGDNFAFITDRKKEIIVTSGGENIAPSMIEAKLRLIPAIENVVVYGDAQKFLVCLITVNIEFLNFLKSKSLYPYKVPESLEEASRDKHLYQYIDGEIKITNKDLAQVQTIKRFKILPVEFQEGDELTSTKKLKRRITYEKYIKEIKDLYGDLYTE